MKKDSLEKHLIKSLHLIDPMRIKNPLGIGNFLLTKNRLKKLRAKKRVIESQTLNVNRLQKLLVKNHQRFEHLEHLTQNPHQQKEKRAHKLFTDFA